MDAGGRRAVSACPALTFNHRSLLWPATPPSAGENSADRGPRDIKYAATPNLRL